jgi:nitrite reductase (NADH) small subunit
MTGYVKVARLEELAEGEGRTVEAAGRWIAVFRTAHGVFAVDNACPHMAGPLGAGRLDGFVVTCPLHGWRIDVRTGRSPTNEYVRVGCYETRVEDGAIMVRVS